VDVDEARRDRQAVGVDDARRRRVAQPAHVGDAAGADADVGREPRVAAAVEDAAVANQDVVSRRRLCEDRRVECE